MGKESALFSEENPFWCKPQPETVESRKRKREKVQWVANPNPNPDSIPPKRKKLEDSEEGESPKMKKKKRKRDEFEKNYELKRRYDDGAFEASEGLIEEGAVAVVGEKRKADDFSLEMVVSKEGIDDELKMMRTVFVGNLPLKTKRKELLKEFAKFGEVESVRIRSVPLVETKIPRKFAIFKGKINDDVGSMHAYIVFKDEQSALASLSHNMAEVGGHHIRVGMACPPHKKIKGGSPLYERNKTVFVGNLPLDVKDEELYQLFCGSNQSESTVEAVRVIRDPHTRLGKGIAYVLFKTREAANSTCRRRDLKIRDRSLRACNAKSKPTPLKRKRSELKPDFPHNTAYTIPENDTPIPYQGLQASKSGILKKSSFRTSHGDRDNSRPKRSADSDQFSGKKKRPADTARKSKQLKKRKHEYATPENTHQSKKQRKN